jgi:excisionase family DNA binding protein
MTVRESAEFLSVSPSTLYGWIWQRKIAFVKVGRAVRFDIADLEQFIQANRRQARTFSGV